VNDDDREARDRNGYEIGMVLEREIATYERLLPDLLKTHKGEYIVIHGENVLGFRPDLDDAERLAYDHFESVGLKNFLKEPFLLRRIEEPKPIPFIPRNLKPCRT
jgi:hypothetical protein